MIEIHEISTDRLTCSCGWKHGGIGTAAGGADFHLRFPNWDRDARAYVAGMEAGRGGRHALCDHAYGICES